MASLYERAAAKVKEKFTEYGVLITYKRATSATNNLVGGTSTPGAPTTVNNVAALVLPESKGPNSAFDNRRDDNSLRLAELRYLKIAAACLTFTPKPDDVVTFAGKDWKVLGCSPVDITGSNPLVHGCGVVAL